ncbi:MAG TPA: sugar-transfer associated ATP-grasp domain-containing protein [Fibrobacteria bacterium]|nr:sugar-transfer associated ATP-grasp domain-containing protein [Fibrobacteria bacterium]
MMSMNVSAMLKEWKEFKVRCSDLMPMNARNLDVIFRENPRASHGLVNDKVVAKGIMETGGVSVPKTIAVIENFFDLQLLDGVIDSNSEFVIKPANGSGGSGVFLAASPAPGGVITASGRFASRAEIQRHVTEILYGNFSGNVSDKALIEERLHPHPLFTAIWPVGLADIRLIVYHKKPVLSMVRIPTKASGGTANLHQGGVGVGLDVATGRTLRAVCKGREIRLHPDSKFCLPDIEIPNWQEVLSTGVKAAELFPLGYVGVDLILDKSGAVKVLELNARPGLQIQIATGIGLRSALR